MTLAIFLQLVRGNKYHAYLVDLFFSCIKNGVPETSDQLLLQKLFHSKSAQLNFFHLLTLVVLNESAWYKGKRTFGSGYIGSEKYFKISCLSFSSLARRLAMYNSTNGLPRSCSTISKKSSSSVTIFCALISVTVMYFHSICRKNIIDFFAKKVSTLCLS